MIGRFLEFSVATPDIQLSLDFYLRLGFTEAQVGEAVSHPYAVVTDGRISIGLHQEILTTPRLTFVKPNLLTYLSELERLDIKFESRRLGNDVFNELSWRDPSDHMIHLVEARTFSPSKRPSTNISDCGYFQEIALPANDNEAAKYYWEQFGFVGMDEPEAWLAHVSCTSDTIDLGLYDPALIRKPSLLFETENLEIRLTRLAEKGIEPSHTIPSRSGTMHATVLTAPEGTPILITAAMD